MTHTLKNELLEIHIDLPLDHYTSSRFDWTGKITTVKFKNSLVSSAEKTISDDLSGKGFYNEFGFDSPIAYNETEEGDWFHKIGIGLLKKDNKPYFFATDYPILSADFKVTIEDTKVIITCTSASLNGYSYILRKEIRIEDNCFIIHYYLQNTGEKIITTNEYVHNFLALDKDFIGPNYHLKFPFEIKPAFFGETVNPEGKVEMGQNTIGFNASPNEPFYFSNLSGDDTVEASWELINTKKNIGISEKGSFKTAKVNLWGCQHVICPELFIDINVAPNQSMEWSRTYTVFELNH
jgi:hypothetical protein